MTALDSVARPPAIVRGVAPAEAHGHARRLLDKVGLLDRAGLYPEQPLMGRWRTL